MEIGFERRWLRPLDWKHWTERCHNKLCKGSGLLFQSLLKASDGYRINREHWVCSPQCLQTVIEQQLVPHYLGSATQIPKRTTMPLGLMMLARGIIRDEQLRDALDMQRSTGKKIGSCLREMRAASEQDIASSVAAQWGCPVYPGERVQSGCAMLVPLRLLERYRMLPVHWVSQGKRLFVAFSDRVNHTALYSLEQMLGCETEPCIITDSALSEHLAQRAPDAETEVSIPRPGTVFEAARIVRGYAQQIGAAEVRLCGCAGDIWLRMLSRRRHLDLVLAVR